MLIMGPMENNEAVIVTVSRRKREEGWRRKEEGGGREEEGRGRREGGGRKREKIRDEGEEGRRSEEERGKREEREERRKRGGGKREDHHTPPISVYTGCGEVCRLQGVWCLPRVRWRVQ